MSYTAIRENNIRYMAKDKSKIRHAKDEKCCKCGKPAVCFWPIIDPDVQDCPYCRVCVEKAKMSLLKKLTKI